MKKKIYRCLSPPDSIPGYAEQRIIDYAKKHGTVTSSEAYRLSSKRTEPLKNLLKKHYIGESLPVKVSIEFDQFPELSLEYYNKRLQARATRTMELQKRGMEEAVKQGRMTKEEMKEYFQHFKNSQYYKNSFLQ